MHAWPAQECWRLVTEGVQQALKHTLLLFDAFYDVEAKVAGCMCCV
jgi:aconitase B